MRRSAPNNDSRPRSVAREPRSREHLSVSLAPPRETLAFLRVCFDFANRELGRDLQGREGKSVGKVNRCGRRIQSVREGGIF